MDESVITVAGGTGFLGGRIVRRLADAGIAVRVAARRPAPAAAGDRVEFRRTDIREPDDVDRAMEGAHAVVNAVSLYVERRGLSYQDIHVDAAGLLAERAAEAGVSRFVHVSGLGVDDPSPSRYIDARARGEARVRKAFPGATILRPSVIFGPGDAFLSTLRQVTLAPVVPLFGSGQTRLQPVHVDDVAAAAATALDDPLTAGRTFELGGPDVLTYRRIVEMVLEHLGRKRFLLPVPFGAWHLLAGMGSLLPNPPLTRDQVALLERDNVVGGGAASFAELGIEPRTLADSLGESLG